MKKFEIPQMSVVHLVSSNVIYASGCTSVCNGFTCDDCACTGYGTCIAAFTCEQQYTCKSSYECNSY